MFTTARAVAMVVNSPPSETTAIPAFTRLVNLISLRGFRAVESTLMAPLSATSSTAVERITLWFMAFSPTTSARES